MSSRSLRGERTFITFSSSHHESPRSLYVAPSSVDKEREGLMEHDAHTVGIVAPDCILESTDRAGRESGHSYRAIRVSAAAVR